jgi:ABC-type nitrate/sulfonate/bicarbonate transport system substrate-binding protein
MEGLMNFKTAVLIGFVLVLPFLASVQEGFDFPVAASSKVLGYAPLWVAAGKGFFKREGLNSEVSAMRGTVPAMQAEPGSRI